MKIVVIGGTGLIGSKLVNQLRANGHEPVAASPNTGVNTLTGEGLHGAQEELIKSASIPYSIVHATQFFEFIDGIADAATDGNTVRLPPALIQPMAADDVASAVGRVAVGPPLNGTEEIAGPDQFRLDELIRERLRESNDPREVITDWQADPAVVAPLAVIGSYRLF